jgi:hypothetical protein
MEGRKNIKFLYLTLLSLLVYGLVVVISAFWGHGYKLIISFLLYYLIDVYLIIKKIQ